MSDITLAASANAFVQLFNALRDNFQFAKSDSGSFGPFSASYSVKVHLAGGTLQLNDDGTIQIQDVDIVWDILSVQVCFNWSQCFGGYCIVPDPWNGCLVSLPKICLGGQICVPLDLSGLVSEITDIKAKLAAKYFIDPGRQAGWTDLDAEFNGKSNKWQIFIDPDWVNIEPIDIPDTIENIFENIVKDAINNLFPPGTPQWIKDLVWDLIGPILDLVIGLLGIVGSIADFIENLLDNSFNLLALLETAVADYLASQYPIYEFEDPYPVLPGSGGLIPVKIPIRNLTSTINSKEMVVLADVG